jgi:hypothetical protein
MIRSSSWPSFSPPLPFLGYPLSSVRQPALNRNFPPESRDGDENNCYRPGRQNLIIDTMIQSLSKFDVPMQSKRTSKSRFSVAGIPSPPIDNKRGLSWRAISTPGVMRCDSNFVPSHQSMTRHLCIHDLSQMQPHGSCGGVLVCFLHNCARDTSPTRSRPNDLGINILNITASTLH